MKSFAELYRMDLFAIILTFFSPTFSQGCDLVPDPIPPLCMDLTSQPLIRTDVSQFGALIEGASTNPRGQMFAVNYGNSSTTYILGQIYPQQRMFYTDANMTSLLNGIRFLNDQEAYAVDAVNHRVLKLNITVQDDTSVVVGSTVFCQNSTMLQPNDLTLSKIGTVFTSGMRWLANTNNTHGDIWSCTQNGEVKLLEVMGRTNGIDLSPDEQLLYVSESYNNEGVPNVQRIWVYDANVNAGTISGKRLFADFADVDSTAHIDIDGMKTDVNGNLFVTRHGGRQVVIFNKEAEVIGKISLSFPNPTNLEFGGSNGKTLFIVGKCEDTDKGCVDTIEVTSPGRSWSNLQ